MSITFANAKNGCQGSGSSTSTPASTLSLFTSETKGYNFYKNKSASNKNWEAAVFGRAHNYSSTNETYDYTLYVFARKLNSASSHGDFKVDFKYRGKSYTTKNSRYIQSSGGKVRLIAYHTFSDLNLSPGDDTTIGATITGPSGTEAAGTITLTDTAKFSGGASWSVYVQSDSSIKLEGTNLTTNRGFRHAWVWQWKRSSASSYTTDATTNCDDNNTATSLSHTFSGLVRNTSYDVRARFYLRNYDPTDDTGNNPVPLSSRTIVRTATTDKSDLSGSASLSGNRYVGGKLTVSVNNPDNATLEYQWCTDTNDSFTSNDGTQIIISGETSSTYTVTSDHVGKYIYCKITLIKDNYNTKFIRKYTQGTVYKRDITASVTISGNSTYGQTLTANVTCNSTGTKTYQWWYSTSSTATSGTNISGATSSTYTIGSGLVGKYIGCTVSIAESDTYTATSSWDIVPSAVTKATNPLSVTATQSGSVIFSTSAQSKSFTAGSGAQGSLTYSISSQKNSSGTTVSYFTIPTNTNNSISIAANTPADTYTLTIYALAGGNSNYNTATKIITYTLTVNKASGSGTVTMSGWTYGEIVPNPTPSSSTNGTSGVTYNWYDSNKNKLSAKPTSTSNAGIYYVTATFPQVTDYNAYTTGYVGFTVLPSISISASQDYLKGDYGAAAGTISYSLGGGVGSCTNITLTSNSTTIFNNTAITTSASTHPNAKLSGSIFYSIAYKDHAGAAKTTTGTKTVSFPYAKDFNYTYSYINASGTKVAGTSKGFTNDGTAATQFCLTATEWNDMNKYLYSVAFRENNWSNSGLTAPKVDNAIGAQLTATVYNNAVTLAEKITGKIYNRVTSGSRITSEHLNGFRTIINKNR